MLRLYHLNNTVKVVVDDVIDDVHFFLPQAK